MFDSSFLPLVQNAAFLLALALVFDSTLKSWQFGRSFWKQILLGLLIGIIGIAIMNTPWVYGNGLIFDTRSILLSASGLFFGSVPTLIAMVMTAIFRFTQGGAYFTGISVIVATSLLGIFWRKLRKRPLINMSLGEQYLFGLVVHIVMLLLMLTQPLEIALPLLSKISLPIMAIYPVGSTLLSAIMLNRLRREQVVEEIKLAQQRLKSLVSILQYPAESIQRFLDFALEESLKLTHSKIGYICYYSEKTKKFTVNSWSKNVMDECAVADPMTCYELDNLGIWAEAVRQGKPIILNNFQTSNPLKKGFPPGHVQITRFLTLPVFDDTHIVAVVGVANKETDYGESDISQLTLMMDVVWKTTERKQAIEDLRVSEENYRLLFDQAADGVYISSQDGELLDVNASGCDLSGYSRQELPSIFQTMLTGGQDSDVELPHLIKQVKAGKVVVSENKLAKKNGEALDVEIRTRMLPDGRIQKIVRDISGQKKAEASAKQVQVEIRAMLQTSDDSRRALLSVVEDQKIIEDALRESEEKYRNLFENITQGFALHKIILDDSGIPVDYRFLVANPAYEQLTGLKVDSIIGKTVREILPEVEQSWIDLYGKVAITGEAHRFEDYTKALGRYYDVTAFCPKQGYFAVVVSDISERKLAEEEINKLNLELEDRVRSRTSQLESANQELEAFSYSISHDLRAPLRSINGFSQIIIDDYSATFGSDLMHYFDLILKNSNVMGQLVDDLLNFSRLGRQELTKVKGNPAPIIREVIESMQPEILKRKIKFKIDELPECEADPSLLRQVYMNLISNSIKFTRNQTEPLIEIGYTHASPPGSDDNNYHDLPCYFVRDNGVGFDMKFYDKLFGVFQRLHRAEEFEGTGVGLAIVQRIIDKHGGTVWAESTLEKGSTFYFTLGDNIYD